MAKNSSVYIPNQVFVGLPWRNVRRKYDNAIKKLEKKYPIYFEIVGKNDTQTAEDLFGIIKSRIASSSWAIFDATGGNANVSLEYGYAEGIDVQRSIFLSDHKSSRKPNEQPIISDLGGKRRVPYKNEAGLLKELEKFCKEHDYTKRYEKALAKLSANMSKGNKRSARFVGLKIIRSLDGNPEIRRADLVQSLAAENYKNEFIEKVIKGLHIARVIVVSPGKNAKVQIA